MNSSSIFMKFLKTPYTEDRAEQLTRQLQLNPVRPFGDKPVCEFCADPNIVSIYGANRMSTGELISCWRWCACAECERLIDSNAWDDFSSRIAARLKQMLPPAIPSEVILQGVWSSLAMFFKDATRVEAKASEQTQGA